LNINDFIQRIEEEFEEIPKGQLTADVHFKTLVDWTSVNALLLMALISTEYDVEIQAEELRNCNTVGELYTIVEQRKVT